MATFRGIASDAKKIENRTTSVDIRKLGALVAGLAKLCEATDVKATQAKSTVKAVVKKKKS